MNPVANVAKARSNRDKTRRAYTQAEFEKLVADFGVIKRRMVYAVAGYSGLRRSECARLKVRDIDLSMKPCWLLRASGQKSQRPQRIPMLPACAACLRLQVIGKRPHMPVFPKVPGLKQLYRDQKKVGIVKRDAEGRKVDWHSLRYYFCTLIARHLPLQKVRILMRHRDIRTTINLYSDLGLADVGDDVWNWPEELT